MGLSMPTFTDGTAIAASALRDRGDDVEEFLNRGIVSGDLKTSSKWVDRLLIYKPEFYGSPAPRAECVSGDVHYRFRDDVLQEAAVYHGEQVVGTWIPIHGLSVTVRNPWTVSVRCTISASLYAFTIFGSTSYVPWGQKSADFALFLDQFQQTGTTRGLYVANGKSGLFGRENIGIVGMPTVPTGTHNISVKINLQATTYTGTAPNWKHTFVVPRSINVDFHALE